MPASRRLVHRNQAGARALAKEQARYHAAAEKAGGSLAEFVKERLK